MSKLTEKCNKLKRGARAVPGNTSTSTKTSKHVRGRSAAVMPAKVSRRNSKTASSRPANANTSQRRTGARELCERERQATLTLGQARLDLAPHGALEGALSSSAHAPAPFVAGPPPCTSDVSRLGAGVRIDTRGWVEAVGVEEGVPLTVGVRRGTRCDGGHGRLSGLGCSNRDFSRGACGARGRLQRTRHAGSAKLGGRDRRAALDGQARDQPRLSEGNGAPHGGDAVTASRCTLRQRCWGARPRAGATGGSQRDCWPDQGCRRRGSQRCGGRRASCRGDGRDGGGASGAS